MSTGSARGFIREFYGRLQEASQGEALASLPGDLESLLALSETLRKAAKDVQVKLRSVDAGKVELHLIEDVIEATGAIDDDVGLLKEKYK